jgi:hypothetical protein
MYTYAGGVITPVLQLFQSIQQNRGNLTAACISNDATHRAFLLNDYSGVAHATCVLYNYFGAFFNCFFKKF